MDDAGQRPRLVRSSTGPDVVRLKELLAERGYDPGPRDGEFGTRTHRAVVAFQQRAGLTADGMVGPRTWEALEAPPDGEPSAAPAAIRRTSSVTRIASSSESISALDVARRLWSEHPAYARSRDALEALAGATAAGDEQSGEQWVHEIEEMLDVAAMELLIREEGDRVLHGRLMLAGLAALVPELGAALGDEILGDLRAQITPPPDMILRRAPLSQETRLVGDLPADVDLLDREPFGKAVATLLRRQRDEPRSAGGPILVHLYGPWGSGKTSLYGFIREALEEPDDHWEAQQSQADQAWLCVTFNAWRHQRTAPPWWWLMDAVYHGSVSNRPGSWRLGPSGEAVMVGRPALPTRRRAAVFLWRWGLALVALAALGMLIVAAFLLGVITIERVSQAEGAVKASLGFLAAVGGAVVVFRSARSSLLVGSPRAATALLRSGGDPFRRVHDRYRSLVERIGCPLLVFVDDLDRCQPKFVVELLEGVNTIFTDVPVTYLVAADREWVSESFEREYGDFGAVMGRPGRSLGYLFLEKTFAVSAPIPRTSPAVQERYWKSVLASQARPEDVTPDQRRKAREEVAGRTAQEALAKGAELDASDNSGDARALREAVVVRVAEAVATGERDHVLTKYLRLMEQNPRSLKRLRNAYTVALCGRVTTGNVRAGVRDEDCLVRWTILTMRWPGLAARLVDDPALLATLGNGAVDLPESMRSLGASEGLRRLLAEPVQGFPPDLASWLVDEYGPSARAEHEHPPVAAGADQDRK